MAALPDRLATYFRSAETRPGSGLQNSSPNSYNPDSYLSELPANFFRSRFTLSVAALVVGTGILVAISSIGSSDDEAKQTMRTIPTVTPPIIWPTPIIELPPINDSTNHINKAPLLQVPIIDPRVEPLKPTESYPTLTTEQFDNGGKINPLDGRVFEEK